MISNDGISVDPVKIEVINKWKTSTNVTEVTSFLGWARYYLMFVERFMSLTAPLIALKDKKFEWTKK